MLSRLPIQINAYIKVGAEPEVWLGFFRSMREAVNLLCPPVSYRVRVTNGESVGGWHYRQRPQRAGLVLSTEQANLLLEHHKLSFRANHQEVTVRLVRVAPVPAASELPPAA